ncbi:hypothetical protein [Candidatus Nitrosotalea bavarica]|uniref:hypothetical protein n=1 Tax=Candidatus Nitrosotalea bavarica TaxID=1903277 RepID=UPI000C71286E|nr:hypothetical protein [Candidatus Nitrosotalea bavarica]
MKLKGRKHLYRAFTKMQGADHYGQCPKCEKWHKKGDVVFSNSRKRYCIYCYVIVFGKYDLKKFVTEMEQVRIESQ